MDRHSKLFIALLFGGGFLFLTILSYTDAQKTVFHYPEDRLERNMVENGYSNLASMRSPIGIRIAYEYDYALNYVEGHCPIPNINYRGSDLVKNKNYIVTIYEKTIFGITSRKSYHDCGGTKFFYTWPKKEWNLDKASIGAADQVHKTR